jgi:hypothetical protein
VLGKHECPSLLDTVPSEVWPTKGTAGTGYAAVVAILRGGVSRLPDPRLKEKALLPSRAKSASDSDRIASGCRAFLSEPI